LFGFHLEQGIYLVDGGGAPRIESRQQEEPEGAGEDDPKASPEDRQEFTERQPGGIQGGRRWGRISIVFQVITWEASALDQGPETCRRTPGRPSWPTFSILEATVHSYFHLLLICKKRDILIFLCISLSTDGWLNHFMWASMDGGPGR